MSHELCFSHQLAVQTLHGSIARCRLALIGPRIDVVRSEIDPPLPVHSIRVRADDCQLLIDPADWIGCRDELDAHAHSWLLEHVDFRLARPRSTAPRYDEACMRA